MTLQVNVIGSNSNTNKVLETHVHGFKTVHGQHAGFVVLTDPLRNFIPTVVPFINELFGNQMNQAISFGGTPELITDGGSGGTEWTGTANQGTWNFADSGKTTITSALNNDSATFDDAGTIDMSGYTAISGLVDLDTYNAAQNTIVIQFGLAGIALGNSVDLDDYINVSDFSEQAFAIPKEDLGINELVVDEMSITVLRSGGTKPTIKFDNIQIEETGTPAVFKVSAAENQSDLHVKKVRFLIADAHTGIVTGSTTTYPTMPGIAYDKILGLSALTIGIVVQIVLDGVITTAVSIKQMSDMIGIGADVVTLTSDGTNTFMVLELEFSETIVLKRGQENTSFISLTINDDLSGLLLFTGAARGAYEV